MVESARTVALRSLDRALLTTQAVRNISAQEREAIDVVLGIRFGV